ncbi:MFS transporter [Hyphomonas sp.]|uniref:MFS transporter n=1 Tax=Hyphomonas sp. TaxID=87 RepID=UPI003919D629
MAVSDSSSRVSLKVGAAFALPSFTFYIMNGPIVGILPVLYAKERGLDLAAIGTAMLIARMLDAITDPAIGLASDRTRTRWGSRKPYMMVGALLTAIGIRFLFAPPEGVDIVYFFIVYTLMFLTWTMIEIPHSAWISELTRNYDERSKIVTYRTIAAYCGALLVVLVPLLPIFESTAMSLQVMDFIGWFLLVMVPLTMVITLWIVPRGDDRPQTRPEPVGNILSALRLNKPFWFFLAAFTLCHFAVGVAQGLFFLYLDSYLGIGEMISAVYVPSLIVSILTMPLWLKVMVRVGKRTAWVIGMLGLIALSPLFLLLPSGEQSFWPYLFLDIAYTLFYSICLIAPIAMLADIVDYDIFRSGGNRAGQYNAFQTLVLKAIRAIGSSLALIVIGLAGFNVAASQQTADALLGLKVTIAIVPAILLTGAVLIMLRYPLTARKHQILRRWLERRDVRLSNDEGKGARING